MLPILAGSTVGIAVDTTGLCGLELIDKFKELGSERLREEGSSIASAFI